MTPCKLYVSVSDHRIYSHPDDAPWEYAIEVEKQYVPVFQQLFEQVNELEFLNFWRSHLPYIPYHHDETNHTIDLRTKKVYALIHEFSDSETKEFIEGLPYFR